MENMNDNGGKMEFDDEPNNYEKDKVHSVSCLIDWFAANYMHPYCLQDDAQPPLQEREPLEDQDNGVNNRHDEIENMDTQRHGLTTSETNHRFEHEHREPDDLETPGTVFVPLISDLRDGKAFVDALKGATIDNERSQLPDFAVERLHNPRTFPTGLTSDQKLSLKLFLISTAGSDNIYSTTCNAIMDHHPEDNLHSLWQVKRELEEVTGIVEIKHDMCIDSCVGFTGPFSDLDACPECGKPRYHSTGGQRRKPYKQFTTVPLAMQLQALYSTIDGARAMLYSHNYTNKLLDNMRNPTFCANRAYSDFFDGTEWINIAQSGRVDSKNDTVLMLSIDGAQLYRNKKSHCWMYLWIVLQEGNH